MPNDEQLREALHELRILRERETNALLSGDKDESIRQLLNIISETFSCDLTMIVRNTGEQQIATNSSLSKMEGHRWDSPSFPSEKVRRIVDLHAGDLLPNDFVGKFSSYRSFISVPLDTPKHEPTVLVCLSTQAGLFSKSDSMLLGRFSKVVSQALERLELKDNNAFLAAVIEGSSSSLAVGEVSDDGLSLIYVNSAFEELTGYSKAEALGSSWKIFTSEPKHSDVATTFRQAFRDKQAGSFLLRNRRKNGTKFWNQITLYPITGKGSDPKHIVVTQMDVSNRVEAEREHDEVRGGLEAALSSAGEGFLALDKDGTVIYANSRFREFVSSYPVNWGIGSKFTDIWAEYLKIEGVPDDVAKKKAQECLDHLLTKESSHEATLPDGRTVLVNERPIIDGGAVIVASDITPMKAAQKKLRQRAVAIENTQDGIAITDNEGRVSYANPSLLALWKLPNNTDILGRLWTDFYEPLEVNRSHQNGNQLETTNTGYLKKMRLRVDGPDPDIHEVSLTTVTELGQVLTLHDISDRIRDERDRVLLREKMQSAQRQEALGQMAAGLAHDFNNLLSAVTGSANLIAEDSDTPEKSRAAARRILASGYGAAELVGKLLDFGSREQTKSQVELVGLLANSLELALSSIRPGIILSSDLGDIPVVTFACQTDFIQLVLNLIINAQDSLGSEGGEIRLRLDRAPALPAASDLHLGRINADQKYVSITVQDNGEGIAPDKLGQIFEPYFTTKGDSGTGLGLAVVSSIVVSNDAAITVRSQLVSGTCFTVFWPITLETRMQVLPRESILLGNDPKILPVLVVDDDSVVAHLIASLLEQNGVEVAVCEDPFIALEAITEDSDSWGCLIAGYNLQEPNSGQLIEEVSNIAPDLPRLILTACASPLQHLNLNLSSVDAILAKPVVPDMLLRAVKDALARRFKIREQDS